MALKKVRVNGSDVEIRDNRITGVDTTPTQNSTNVVTSGGVYDTINSIDYSNINPIQTKTYTGVLGTANTVDGATFYFAKIVPTNYYAIWKIKYKIRTYVPDKNGYDMVAEVMLSGDQSSLRSYSSMNTVSPNYPAYYHSLYRATSAGVTNGYGHTLGVRLYSAYNPITAGYERTIDIEVYETENCTLTFFDECLLYANIPGTGATNYSARSEINYCTNGLQETSDADQPNYQNRIYYSSTKAAADIYRYQVLLRTLDKKLIPVSSANNSFTIGKTYTTTPFDPFGEVYYYNSTTAISSGGNIGNATLYRQVLADLRYSFDLDASATYKLTAREPVYLTATLQPDGTAVLTVPSGSTIGPLVQSLPTSDDGLIYIYLGQAYEDTYPYRLELNLTHPIYWYKNGRVREVTPETINLKGNELSREFVYDTTGGTTSVDSGYAWAKKIKGNTIVWNQLNKYVYTAGSGKTINNVTLYQNSDGTFYLNGTASADTDFYCLNSYLAEYYPIPLGHIGLFNLNFISGTVLNADADFRYGSVRLFQGTKIISKNLSTARYLYIRVPSGCVCTNATFTFNLFDLTQMFGSGNEPSTVEEFEELFPLNYYAYNEGQLLSFNGTSIKTIGFNLWDEEWESGYIDASGVNANNGTKIRSKNYIHIFPNTAYYIQSPTSFGIRYYDINKNFLSIAPTSDRVFTTPSNAYYFRFFVNDTTAYNYDICINLSDTTKNGTYKPYEEHTKDISFYQSIQYNGSTLFPNGLLSAGSVYDEVTPTKAIKRIGVVDLGTLTWDFLDAGTEHERQIGRGLTDNKIHTSGDIANICSTKYLTNSANAVYGHSASDIISSSSGNILAYDPLLIGKTGAEIKTAMSGVMLYYELATPVEVTLDKMEDTYYMVDANGTEELLPTNTSTPTTTPIKADVVYGSNAEGTLQNLVEMNNVIFDKLADLEARVAALEV